MTFDENVKAIDAALDRKDKLLALRDRQIADCQRHWLAAAEKALAGDLKDLDLLVGLTKENGKVVQS